MRETYKSLLAWGVAAGVIIGDAYLIKQLYLKYYTQAKRIERIERLVNKLEEQLSPEVQLGKWPSISFSVSVDIETENFERIQ